MAWGCPAVTRSPCCSAYPPDIGCTPQSFPALVAAKLHRNHSALSNVQTCSTAGCMPSGCNGRHRWRILRAVMSSAISSSDTEIAWPAQSWPAVPPTQPDDTCCNKPRLVLDASREAPALWAIAIGDYLDAGPQRMLHTADRARHEQPAPTSRSRRVPSTWEESTTPTLVGRGEHNLVVSAGVGADGNRNYRRRHVSHPGKGSACLNYTNAVAQPRAVEPFLDRQLK